MGWQQIKPSKPHSFVNCFNITLHLMLTKSNIYLQKMPSLKLLIHIPDLQSNPSPQPSNLHIPPTRHTERLATNIAEQRTRNRQHRTRRLSRRARPPERDIEMLVSPTRPGSPLRLRYTQSNPVAIRRGDEGTGLLGLRQARQDVAEGDRVGAHAELRAPLLRDGLGEPDDARLGLRVVGLPRVAVQPGRRRDVDDVARRAVFDAEVGRCGPDQLERRRVVQREDRVPLLVCHLERGRDCQLCS